VIFQPHLNHYVDNTQAYIEKKLDISIPVYTVEMTESQDISNSETFMAECSAITTVQQVTAKSDPVSDDMDKIDDTQLVDNRIDETPPPSVNQSSMESVMESGAKTIETQPVVSADLIEKLNDTVNKLNAKLETLLDEVQNLKITKSDIDDQSNNSQPNVVSEVDTVEIVRSDQLSKEDDSSYQTTSDVRMMLSSARQSYWSGDSQRAEKIYLDLVSLDDMNPDFYGELGNVYYAQGKWKDAGKAYYEAAVRLLTLKDSARVQHLLQVIQGLDSDSASQLRKLISGSSIE